MNIRLTQLQSGDVLLQRSAGVNFLGPPVSAPAPVYASTLPAIVQNVNGSTAPASVSNGPSASAPGNAGSAVKPNASPVASFSLWSWLGSVITNPGQHIIAVIVLALVAWWVYKHILKRI